jgi:hypothetical protein
MCINNRIIENTTQTATGSEMKLSKYQTLLTGPQVTDLLPDTELTYYHGVLYVQNVTRVHIQFPQTCRKGAVFRQSS